MTNSTRKRMLNGRSTRSCRSTSTGQKHRKEARTSTLLHAGGNSPLFFDILFKEKSPALMAGDFLWFSSIRSFCKACFFKCTVNRIPGDAVITVGIVHYTD